VDGDTIDIGGQRIRLHGIDAPESSQYCYRADAEAWACGASATELMASLVAETTATCDIRDQDRDGRAIAICYAVGKELNAAMVRFFSSLKTVRIGRKSYRTRDQARADVFAYIERFYNPRRRHSTLGYLSPMAYERRAMEA
jgi:putative transposase